MNAILFVCLALSALSIIVVLGLGIFSMAKGGEFNKKYGNKLMRARVMLQGLTLLLLVTALFLAKH